MTFDVDAPLVTIDQAVGQADPTGASPIHFTVVFSEPVTGFTSGDVTLGGTAGATTAVVTGSGTTYDVAVSAMTTTGTVIVAVSGARNPGTVTISIPAGSAFDTAGNPNAASTSTDNSVVIGPSSHANVPTLSEWALIALLMSLLAVAALRLG